MVSKAAWGTFSAMSQVQKAQAMTTPDSLDDVQQLADWLQEMLRLEGHDLVTIKDIPTLLRLARAGVLRA